MKAWKMNVRLVALVGLLCCLALTTQSAKAQTYTNDPDITHFTSGIVSYATFSQYDGIQGCEGSTFTPTSSELITTGCRIFDGTLTGTGLSTNNNWIEASFSSPVSTIVVFPNIDHVGSAYDGYQYAIAGSNDGLTWTLLFDATSVSGEGEPFTLSAFTGTAPTSVNNVLTPQTVGLPAGCSGTNTPCAIGYIATFNFSTAYQFYAFGASTEAVHSGNADQELSAVGAGQTIVGTPVTPGTPQTFAFNPNEGTLDVVTAIFPTSQNLQNQGVIPIISSFSVPPTAPNSLWANSPLATATCISLSAAAGNCAPKREVCQTPMSTQAPTGANCPFDPGIQDVLLADNYDPVTTITDMNITGDPGVVSLNDIQACPFSAPFASLPCPSNGSKSFTGPGESKTVHGSSNSFYYYVTGILPPRTTPTGVVNVNGVNWVNGNNPVQMTLTATPPSTPTSNPTGFYPSPIDYVAYLNLPASSAPPDPTLPPFTFPPNPPEGTVVFSSNGKTASNTVISNGVSGNGSTCPGVLDPTTNSSRILPADPTYSFPVTANLGTLAEGAYNLYYETEDCTRTAERLYTFQPGSTWVTQYKSLAFTADDTPPSINITVPSPGAIYPANASVAPSFSCTDGGPNGGSGVKTCAGSSSPLDTKPTGGILTSKTFTVTSGDNVGNMATPKTVSYSVSCMYATNTINPTNLVRGQNFTFMGSVTNCTGSLQAITVSLVLSGPLGASCKNQSLTLVNQLTLPIPPLSKALSFTLGPFSIPKTGCTGTYTLTTTTANKGTTDFVYSEVLNITK
jgi:hypothetical protein